MTENNDSVGKQAKDIADAANTSVETVQKAASFLDGLFGNLITNSFGLLGDKLAYYRFEKLVQLQENVEKKLEARGVERQYVPVAFGLPIVEKATIEEDPILQDKWANLLANARDASYDRPLRRNYSSILADLEPLDAQILDLIVRESLATADKSSTLFVMEKLVENTNIAGKDCENSVRNLIRLGLFKPGVVTGSLSVSGHPFTSYKDTEMFAVTEMGVDFFHAVNDG